MVINSGPEWNKLFEDIAELQHKCQEKYKPLSPLIKHCEKLKPKPDYYFQFKRFKHETDSLAMKVTKLKNFYDDS